MRFLITAPGLFSQPKGHCPEALLEGLTVSVTSLCQSVKVGMFLHVSSFVRAACLAVFAVLVVAAATHRLLPRVLLPHLLPTVLPGELLPHVLPSLFLLCPLFLSPVTVCALYLSVLLF